MFLLWVSEICLGSPLGDCMLAMMLRFTLDLCVPSLSAAEVPRVGGSLLELVHRWRVAFVLGVSSDDSLSLTRFVGFLFPPRCVGRGLRQPPDRLEGGLVRDTVVQGRFSSVVGESCSVVHLAGVLFALCLVSLSSALHMTTLRVVQSCVLSRTWPHVELFPQHKHVFCFLLDLPLIQVCLEKTRVFAGASADRVSRTCWVAWSSWCPVSLLVVC